MKARKISQNDERVLAVMREVQWNSAQSLAKVYFRFGDSIFNFRRSGYVVHKKMGQGDQYWYTLVSGPGGKIWG